MDWLATWEGKATPSTFRSGAKTPCLEAEGHRRYYSALLETNFNPWQVVARAIHKLRWRTLERGSKSKPNVKSLLFKVGVDSEISVGLFFGFIFDFGTVDFMLIEHFDDFVAIFSKKCLLFGKL